MSAPEGTGARTPDAHRAATEIKGRMLDWTDSLGALRETIGFDTYLERVIEEPRIADLAHARIYNMIISHGVDDDGRYRFFKPYLFGLDDQLQEVVEYFRAGAERLDTRKRILLLRGPVSSAKSTLVDLLKVGLEQYARTDEGAVYAIDGCPMNEDPLHLVPHAMRPDIEKDHGVYIEGELCPVCQYRLDHDHGGDPSGFQVKRVFFSEQDRTGIGTFLPSDPKSQDISELVGSINFAKIGEVGVESHPEAYTFDGELNIANRGMMEFIEMLKADEKFLYVLLTLTQEQVIKAPRFPRIYADCCIIAHTNESEYNEFVADTRSEALQDRIIVVDFPYNMSASEEERIYHKLLAGTRSRKHMAPYALRTAAMLAVMSRLEEVEDPKLDLVTKMKLYDGERIGRWGPSDVGRLHEQAQREGMDGISPRYIVNRISTALIQEDAPCLTPDHLLAILQSGLRTHPKFGPADRERYTELIARVHEEYARVAEEAVKHAVVVSMEDTCNRLFRTYLAHAEAYAEDKEVPSTFATDGRGGTGTVPADEDFLRSIEKRVGIREAGKDSYRRQVLAKVGSMEGRGEVFDHKTDDPLRHAIEDIVYEENKNRIRSITTVGVDDPDVRADIEDTKARLVSRHGYCGHCAESLLRFVGASHSGSVKQAQERTAAGAQAS